MIKRRALSAGIAAAIALGVAGCSTSNAPTRVVPTYEQAAGNAFIPANRSAAEVLLGQIQNLITTSQPLIAATVVNIDSLDRSSTLGRLISEHVSARFTQSGYRMVEMKFRNSVYMARDQGELMLTREIRELAASYDAQAVIVGTYGLSSEFVFVNLKVIQPETNVVVAVHDYALPVDETIRSLLRGTR